MKKEILKIFKENGFDEYNCPYFKEEEITDIVNKIDALFAKRIVSRSIGNDTKPVLKELTQELMNKGVDPCRLCIYEDNDIISKECRKCVNENNTNQYYG